jgi:predicted nucleic acid-binding protein
MELQLQLRDDGSLLLSPLHGFNRLQFSQEQAQRFERQPRSAPTWPLLRSLVPPSSEPALARIAAPPATAPVPPDPGPTYLDTGVVLRLICHEPGSSAQLRWFGIEQRQLVSANLLWIEATAALQIKPPEVLALGASHAWLEHLLGGGGVELVPLQPEGVREAAALLVDPRLQLQHPSQAQHLAAALRSGCHRLISGDAALCQAASHCGLIVHAPEDWPPRLSHRR